MVVRTSLNIVAVGQRVRCERMAKRVARHPFRETRFADSGRHYPLDQRLIHVMSALFPSRRVPPAALLRKHELPAPLPIGIWVFTGQCVWQFDSAIAIGEILPVESLDPAETFLQGANDCLWQHRDPVLVPFSLTNGDLTALEVQILDP